MKRKGIKKLTLDFSKETISDDVKTVILEQAKIITHLQQENTTLQKEVEELKKNFI